MTMPNYFSQAQAEDAGAALAEAERRHRDMAVWGPPSHAGSVAQVGTGYAVLAVHAELVEVAEAVRELTDAVRDLATEVADSQAPRVRRRWWKGGRS